MSEDTSGSITGVDGAAVVSRLRGRVDETLYAVAEYDAEALELLYVDDATRTMYPSEAVMHDHFEEIHSYVHVDFVESELFTDELFPVAEEVEHIVTGMDFLKLIRVYRDEKGVFLAVDPDEPVMPLVEVVQEELR